ncbi:hypothetical protein VNO77_19851 [Canavalia gladiata]|uniref:Glycosyltransferase n=1 Tax=Canavalia gladiata TaxID=3824 RepID=A0AAN9QQ02_CANGL
MAKRIHIVVLPLPVFSHQFSIIEFCKRLVCLHQHFHVTCIIPTIDTPIPSISTLLESLPSTIEYTFLTPVKKEDLPQCVPSFVQVLHAMSQSMPSFRNALRSLCSTTPLAALVVDAFAKDALEIAREFNLLSFIYFPSSAMAFALHFHLPSLNDRVLCEYKDHTEAIQIPGCIPIQRQDLPSNFQDRSSLIHELSLECSKRLSLVDGSKLNESECMAWLENQKPNSVLYVSFGSGGTLSQQQLNELALGLGLSGQKFLWVLRPPNDSTEGSYLFAAKDDPLQFLPDGLMERTKGQGLIVPSWAPQIQILSHSSTAGFLTHCGWHSSLESIVLGVPMITFPLFAEQRMNAILLTEVLKVALRPKFNENGIGEREEIAKVIKGLMLGEERKRIEKLKDAANNALKEDGSSTKALSQFGTRVENFLPEPLKSTSDNVA